MNKPILLTVGEPGGPVAGQASFTSVDFPKKFWVKRDGDKPLGDYVVNANGFTLVGAKFQAGEVYEVYSMDLSTSGGYTNGFDFNRIMPVMTGRLAFRGTRPTSKSGRFFDDFHALVRKDIIEQIMTEVPERAMANIEQAAILRVLNGVFRDREFYENTVLIDRCDEVTQYAAPAGFAGWRIQLSNDPKKAVQINNAWLEFDGAITLPLYLFADGKQVWSQQVSVEAGGSLVDFTDLVLSYYASTTRARTFWFGFFQSDLGGAKPVQIKGECGRRLLFSAEPVLTTATGGVIDRVTYQSPGYGPGINLELSSFRDHTATVLAQPGLFDEAVGLQAAYLVLEHVIYSVRSNATQRILSEAVDVVGLQLELNGYAPVSDMSKVEGLAQRIRKELDRLFKQFNPKPKAVTVNMASC